MTDVDELRSLYDTQLRAQAEAPGAVAVAHMGSLRLVTFEGGRGFVTYPPLEGAEAQHLAQLVGQVLDHYRQSPEIEMVEWKTRGHDRLPGLHQALVVNGFAPEAPESIMIGRARLLDVEVPLPPGVSLRRVDSPGDVRAMTAMQDNVFNSAVGGDMAHGLLRRLAANDGMELWVAEAGGQIICAGRLDPVPGTDFAGIWGGATLEAWRGQGIYRALTAARARSALAAGKVFIHSDSTDYSRPILERSGFVKVSTTTPYTWHR